jgi:hypothetical protein
MRQNKYMYLQRILFCAVVLNLFFMLAFGLGFCVTISRDGKENWGVDLSNRQTYHGFSMLVVFGSPVRDRGLRSAEFFSLPRVTYLPNRARRYPSNLMAMLPPARGAAVPTIKLPAQFEVGIPFWFSLIVSYFFFYCVRRANRRILYREENSLCLACGYDLRASKIRCPECGASVSTTLTVIEPRERLANKSKESI